VVEVQILPLEPIPEEQKMPFKDPEKRKKYFTERGLKNKAFIAERKVSRGCLVCGENRHPACLDFHHHNNDKEFRIAEKSYGGSIKLLTREIEKCVVLCATCHRLVHASVITLPDAGR
jgi:hypothetical protein